MRLRLCAERQYLSGGTDLDRSAPVNMCPGGYKNRGDRFRRDAGLKKVLFERRERSVSRRPSNQIAENFDVIIDT